MDVRRCRRCKRKRLDDEPEEVRQYKTCAKCRIIERNKKNSRKPLAEETMLYGLKQFREQQSTENYIEEEGLLKDEFFKRYHNKPFNYDVEIAKVLSNPNYVPPVIHNHVTDEVPNTTAEGPANGPRYQMTMKTNNNGSSHSRTKKQQNSQSQQQQHQQQQQQHHHQQQQQQQQHAQNQQAIHQREQVIDDEEDLYKILSNLGNKDEVREGAVISKTNLDPYLYNNVFDDFQKYLTTILDKLGTNSQIKNLVFLKEFNDDFTTSMSKFDAYTKDRTSLYQNLRLSERQFRSHLLSNLRALYLDSIIACLGLLYKQEYANLNEFKSTTSIKAGFSAISKAAVDDGIKNLKESSISLVYNRKYNLLIITLNHITYQSEGKTYSSEFKQKVGDIYKKLQAEASLPTSNLKFVKLDYDVPTGELVYDKLLSVMDVYSAELQDFIKKLTKDEFIADFINYENTLKVSAKDDESTEGKQPEVAENDQMDIDSEEMDNDQKENAEDVVENEDEDVIIEGATEDGVLDAGDASLLASFLDTSNINGEPVQQAGEEELDDKSQQTMIEKESTVDALDPVLQL
ncbi:conserved hypothetical protein [Candida tropicalis MYA-3404]|uniref:Uncharacterized protein n=1 Tax=Candida tropicalis (strain ATCC MYA-3404 / T1) TaxID=294747 RepID=C5M5U8_CANTT|nr:conserved hypothetical protein [Candida tropicalis MYA-3404]EER34368.1 conserved hypothetical protein [Candida tropicalis MYA-3404]KAG4408238.1 hypothetical protein JTP64_001544 [Candida tropicalis]